ncbi:MAG: succinylglutamate desuccinylase/aspartoacylase family protein [Myxococcota bacterium]
MIGIRVIWLLLVLLLPALPATSAERGDAGGAEWGPLELLGRTIAPGEKLKFSYAQTPSFEAAYLNTVVFVSRGTKPGPTLCLTALIHGDERNGFEVARNAFDAADPTKLAGTLIALPAINVNGFRSGTRYMPDRRDLNREFPGSLDGSNSGIIAYLLHQTATKVCDAVIDLHTGSFDRANLAQIRVDLSHPGALAMARAFGAPVVLGGEGPRGSFRREMMESGVPSIIYEAGLPMRFQPEEIDRGVEGVLNVMDLLGMRDGRASKPTPASQIYSRSQWLRVPMGDGGVFYPVRKLGDRVVTGDQVARIDEPFRDERFTMTTPVAGTIIGMAVPQVVFSGYALIHIAQP